MVGPPEGLILSQRRTLFLEPAPDPKPRHDGIEDAGEGIDGQAGLAGDGAGVNLRDEVQAVFGRWRSSSVRRAMNSLMLARVSAACR